MKTIFILKIKSRKENGKWIPSTGRLVFVDKSIMESWLSNYKEKHPSLEEKDIEHSTQAIKDEEHFYKVYISDSPYVNDNDAMMTAARNKAEAEKIGRQYIRAWSISGQNIQKIEQVA